MTRALTLSTVVAALAVAIAGCRDPYTSAPARPAPPPTKTSEATPGDIDRPGPTAAPAPAPADRPSATERQAARSFAARWANWDWRSAARQRRALARLATGDLARQLRANATSARIDATLARDKPGSRGTVAAIDITTSHTQAVGIVVTREQTYTDGRADLGGRRYRVYVVRLTRERKGWGVSAWEPQP
jgi:hypothetical protein